MEQSKTEKPEPDYVDVYLNPYEDIVEKTGHGERSGKILGAKAGLLFLLNDMGPNGLGIDFRWGQPLSIDTAIRASTRARVIAANSDILHSHND